MAYKSILLAATTLVLSTSVNAIPVTFNYEGTVNNVAPELSNYFSVGDLFTGAYTFESTALADASGPRLSVYKDILSGQFTVGTYTGYLSAGQIGVGDDLFPDSASNFHDLYAPRVGSPLHGAVTGPTIGAYDISIWGITLIDHTGTVFNSQELPLIPPDLAAFDTSFLRIGFQDFSSNSSRVPQVSVFDFHLTGSLTAVPEPSIMWLLGSGIVLIGIARRKA